MMIYQPSGRNASAVFVSMLVYCCLTSGALAFVAASRVPSISALSSIYGKRGVAASRGSTSRSGAFVSAFHGRMINRSAWRGGARGSTSPRATLERRYNARTISLKMTTLEAVNDREIPAIVDFFVTNFWDEDVTLGQRRQLVRELTEDYRKRYGSLVGSRKLPSTLMVARNEGEIVGCVAIEVSVCLGERVGMKARGISLSTPGAQLRPVLANLTVARGARRKGLAQKLVKRCEDAAKEWGYDEVLLLVEESNVRASRLYQKLGYRMIFKDTEAKKVVPSNSSIKDIPCINVCMRRDIKANVFSSLLRLIGK